MPPTPDQRAPIPSESRHLAARFRRRELDVQAERAIAKAVRESDEEHELPKHPNAYVPVDAQALRGVPCLARGVGGTSPGTRPDRIAR